MKHIVLVTIITVTLPLCAQAEEETTEAKPAANKPDREQVFKRRDKDNDGFLTKEEAIAKAKDPAKAESMFTRKDTDGDGKLSLEEFTAKGERGKKTSE
jgi:iduronate 2-sulfatase